MRRRKKRGDDDDDVLVPAAVISLAAPAPQLPEDPIAPEPGYYSSGMFRQFVIKYFLNFSKSKHLWHIHWWFHFFRLLNEPFYFLPICDLLIS